MDVDISSMSSPQIDDFDDRDFRNRAGLEGLHVDLQVIRVEAHRHIEEKTGRHCAPPPERRRRETDDARRRVD